MALLHLQLYIYEWICIHGWMYVSSHWHSELNDEMGAAQCVATLSTNFTDWTLRLSGEHWQFMDNKLPGRQQFRLTTHAPGHYQPETMFVIRAAATLH